MFSPFKTVASDKQFYLIFFHFRQNVIARMRKYEIHLSGENRRWAKSRNGSVRLYR